MLFALSLPVLAGGTIHQSAFASTPAGQDKLDIHISAPKRSVDSLFSYTAEWRVDDGDLFRSTGISIFNASKLEGDNSLPFVTKKLVTAIRDGLMHLEPIWRGITINPLADQAGLSIVNKAGYSLTSVTTRDYTNQTLGYDMAGHSFAAAGVQVALDLVLSADVEFIEGFTAKKADTASQGEIIITLDGNPAVHIKTDGKTTRQLEEDIVKQLSGSQLNQTAPLVPSFLSNYDKNNKPFDGAEVLIPHLSAKAISIDVNDPNLGILTKFKYKDENYAVKVVDPMIMLPGLVVVSFLTAGYFLFVNSRKKKAAKK